MKLSIAQGEARTQNYMAKRSWLQAYLRFLISRDESLLLKLAPLALMGILPPELLSNIIPVFGLADDTFYVVMTAYVMYKTFSRVNAYRY